MSNIESRTEPGTHHRFQDETAFDSIVAQDHIRSEFFSKLLVRPLGCSGNSSISTRWPFPCISVLSPKIEGALDSAKLAAALEQVRRRHSALRVCIVDDAEAGPVFYRIDNPIELQAAPVEAAADWRRVVERELNLPFDTVRGPLMRATALWASDGTSIVLTFHHAIIDALSGARILHDVMRALAGDCLEVLPPLPSVEELIARRLQSGRRRGGRFARRYLLEPPRSGRRGAR